MTDVEGRNGFEYRVGMTDSGLLVEIGVIQYGVPVGLIQVDRTAWPAIVQAVRESMTEQRVEAEASAAIDAVLGDDGD